MTRDEVRSLIGRLKKARTEDYGSEEHETLRVKVRTALTPAQRDQLDQFVKNGPLFDGDVSNKGARDDLRSFGDLVVCCVVKGQQGYTAATYLGQDVSRADTLH